MRGPGADFVNQRLGISAFGEQSVVQGTPVVQIDAVYGILGAYEHETFTALGGTVTASNSEFVCQSGTNANGYGVLRSYERLRYKPGQGATCRFTARFTTGVANSTQRAGLFTSQAALQFGYSGADFGIIYETGGSHETRTLTLSAGASGNETVSITLNGTTTSVDITTGTAAHNAYEIAAATDDFSNWTLFQNGSTVVFFGDNVGVRDGSYSFSNDTTGGTSAGSLAQTVAGTALTTTFIDQDDWNRDTASWLDPTKGNVYQVSYQWLGYGAISFYVEDPSSGQFTLVHQIEYANSNTSVSIDNPTFKVGWVSANQGNTTNLTVIGASAACFVDGPVVFTRLPFSQDHVKASIDTTLTNIVTIRNRAVFAGKVNQTEVVPQFFTASGAASGSNSTIIELYLNSTLGGEPNWTYLNEAESTVEYDTAGTTISGGQLIGSFSLGKNGQVSIDLRSLLIRLQRTDTLTIAAKATGGTTEATAGITWKEN